MVCVRVSDITNPPPVPCSVLDPSVKQQMPWVLAVKSLSYRRAAADCFVVFRIICIITL